MHIGTGWLAVNKYLIIIILAVLIGVGFWSWSNKRSVEPLAQEPVAQQTAPSVPTAVADKKPDTGRAVSQTPPASLDLVQDPNAEKFVRENALNLWQVDPANLQFEKKDNGERAKIVYLQKLNGVPIFGARVSMFIEANRLSRVQNTLSMSSAVEGDFTLTGAQAEKQLKEKNWQVEGVAEPLFYPTLQKLRPVYRVYATREGEAKDVIVDATDGRIIRTISRTHY